MKRSRLGKLGVAAVAVGLSVLAVWGQQKPPVTDVGELDKEAVKKAFKRPYSPYAGRNYPTRPYFGDTHLHTMYSFDAGAFGCRLAKGEEVVASMGERVRLSRPLDFLVVADHSDNMGFFAQLLAGD